MAAPYTRRFPGGFLDKPTLTTPIQAAFLNAMEDALIALLGDTPAADEVGVWVGGAGGALTYQKIGNAQIDAAAAIDKSKLGALNIVDADISGAAAIAKSKLALGASIGQADMVAGNKITASAWGAGPPGSPTTSDIWIATDVDAAGLCWSFRYNGASGSGYKWEFIGGGPFNHAILDNEGVNLNSAWGNLTTVGPRMVLARAGQYVGWCSTHATSGPSADALLSGVGRVSSGGAILANPLFVGRSFLPAGEYQQQSTSEKIEYNAGEYMQVLYKGGNQVNSWAYRTLNVLPVRIA